MHINHNFTNTKIGETICYHVGNLAADRVEQEVVTGLSPKGNIVKRYLGYTQDAIVLQNVSNDLYRRSCAIWQEDSGARITGTGEFELKQQKLGDNKYAYLAKRISKMRNNRF